MTAINGTSQQSGLALDVGEKRVGVAIANLGVRFARPLTTLTDPATFYEAIITLVRAEDTAWIVIGLPRGLQGQETAQTARAQAFGAELSQRLTDAGLQLPVYWIDEALTSVKAEQELAARGKPHDKAAVDALAATYILEDFLNSNLTETRSV